MYIRFVLVFYSALVLAFANGLGQDDGTVTVHLPDLGYIKGRAKQTIGNLGHEKKTYYNFRNIPFADTVSGNYRFSVSDYVIDTKVFCNCYRTSSCIDFGLCFSYQENWNKFWEQKKILMMQPNLDHYAPNLD